MFNKKNFNIVLMIVLIFMPLIELDYLIYEQLDVFNIPRFTTIIRLIILPLLIFFGILLYEKNLKKISVYFGIYLSIIFLYLIVHTQYVNSIMEIMYLPSNFYYSFIYEALYIMTLILPYFFVYLFKIIDEDLIKKISIGLSCVISIPILVSNLLVCSLSTYEGYTMSSFIGWFTGAYEEYIPRLLAGKFFFEQGNTIGILLFMILPILYYYFVTTKNVKERIYLIVLIVIQSLSMMILSTRVATYGTMIVPLMIIVIFIFFEYIIKEDKYLKKLFVLPLFMVVIMYLILPYTPMIKNVELNSVNDQAVKDDKYLLDDGYDKVLYLLENHESKNDEELVLAFEKYGIEDNLMSATPVSYFMDWYPYTFDAYFWLDILFNVPFNERVDGRQIQKLFLDYKLEAISDPIETMLLGIGYTPLMNGSFILEEDFTQQYYSFGLIGSILFVGVWIIIVLYGVIKLLLNFKALFKIKFVIYAISLIFGLVSAYLSGHTLDQYLTTLYMALLAGSLLSMASKNCV